MVGAAAVLVMAVAVAAAVVAGAIVRLESGALIPPEISGNIGNVCGCVCLSLCMRGRGAVAVAAGRELLQAPRRVSLSATNTPASLKTTPDCFFLICSDRPLSPPGSLSNSQR